MEYTIRGSSLGDLDNIVKLDKEAFDLYGTHEEKNIFFNRLRFNPEGCFVLDIDGKISGYITTEKWDNLRDPVIGEDATFSHSNEGKIVNITGLVVAKKYQNKGFGKKLLGSVMSSGRNQGCTHIIVQTSHAQRFYEKNSFTLCKQIHTENGVPMLVYLLLI